MTRPNELEVQDHVSDYYANIRYRDYGLAYHAWVIRGLMEGANGKILDLGCGTGIISELYNNLDIVGIDISPGMLKFHKGKFLQASATDIPFPDDSFDFVVCRSLLHHLPDAVAGLKEIKRVLKPGGKFVCWETNKSWLAEFIRSKTQHGDHFSEFHTSFSDLPSLVEKFLNVTEVKFEGYCAYALFGFPDIINFSRFIPFAGVVFKMAMRLDEWLSKTFLRKLGFAVRIKAVKN